jgi:hypothetical protein
MYMSMIIEHMLYQLDFILIDLMQFVVLTKKCTLSKENIDEFNCLK